MNSKKVVIVGTRRCRPFRDERFTAFARRLHSTRACCIQNARTAAPRNKLRKFSYHTYIPHFEIPRLSCIRVFLKIFLRSPRYIRANVRLTLHILAEIISAFNDLSFLACAEMWRRKRSEQCWRDFFFNALVDSLKCNFHIDTFTSVLIAQNYIKIICICKILLLIMNVQFFINFTIKFYMS